MQYSQTKTVADLIVAMDHLAGRFHQAEVRLSLPVTDARMVGLGGMKYVILGYAFGYAALIYERPTPEKIMEAFSSIALDDTGVIDYRRIQYQVEFTWRIGLQSSVHFQLDTLFHNLLRELLLQEELQTGKPIKQKRAFQDATKQLLILTNLPECGKEYDTLMVLSQMRNSLHNNGIHSKPTIPRQILNGMEFEFVNGHPVTCASWQHILAVIDATLDVLMQILTSSKIQKLPCPIRDDYTEHIAARMLPPSVIGPVPPGAFAANVPDAGHH